jgi:hypothetical protein
MGTLAFVKWLMKREKRLALSLLEIWLMLILKAANGRWVEAEKVMAIAFLLEKVYGLTKACFVPGRIPWSRDVDAALRRLASLGLIEKLPQGGAYRLTERGRMAVERCPLSDVKIRYPFADIQFFIDWNIDTLVEYIRVNYPEFVKT